MILLNNLLSSIEKKSKIIIISQMDRMLDILNNYLCMSGHKFSKLNSSIRGQQRQKTIDSFNNEANDFYILLLNPKSGVKGINLTSANTVIIYDGSINTINEINLGNPDIYYLISDKSSEQMMFKLSLTENIEYNYEKILRYGAYYTFINQDEILKHDIDEVTYENISNIINSATKNKLFEINEDSLNLNIPNVWEHYLNEEQCSMSPK